MATLLKNVERIVRAAPLFLLGCTPQQQAQQKQTAVIRPTPAQIAKSSVSFPRKSSWQGVWKGDDGHIFTFVMNVDCDKNQCDGRIRWTLKNAPPDSEVANRINESGTEYVRGTFEPSPRELHLTGYGVENPGSTVVGTDEYRVVVSKDGRSFRGKSKGNSDTWKSLLSGKRVK